MAIAQYVSGSVPLNTVPPVTLPPAIILSFTGFQIFAPCGGLNAVPYFQVPGSNGPWFTAPAGAVILAPLSFPAGAASGNWVAPGAALLAYGSALGAGVCGAGVCPANTTIPTSANKVIAINRCFTVILQFRGQLRSRRGGQVTLARAGGQAGWATRTSSVCILPSSLVGVKPSAY